MHSYLWNFLKVYMQCMTSNSQASWTGIRYHVIMLKEAILIRPCPLGTPLHSRRMPE